MLIYCIQRKFGFVPFWGSIGPDMGWQEQVIQIDTQIISKTVLGMTKLDTSFETEFEMIEIVLFIF